MIVFFFDFGTEKGAQREGLGPILGRLETRLGVKIVLPCSVALVFLKKMIPMLRGARSGPRGWRQRSARSNTKTPKGKMVKVRTNMF